MKEYKENLLGLDIMTKINGVMDRVKNETELMELTNINENMAMKMMQNKKKDIPNKYENMETKFAQAIIDVFDRWVSEGKVPGVDKNAPKGMSIEGKISMVLNMPYNPSELGRMVGISQVVARRLYREPKTRFNVRLSTALKFEKAFKKYLLSPEMKFVTSEEHLVARKQSVENNALIDTIYKSIREYRQGIYLIVDTRDKETQDKLLKTIKYNVENDIRDFDFLIIDNELSKDYSIKHWLTITWFNKTVNIVDNVSKVPFNFYAAWLTL